MPTKTAPTVEELQTKVTKLQRHNDTLLEEKEELEGHLAETQEQLQESEKGNQRRSDRARQVVVDHHDDAGHQGAQRFCSTAPCPALNALLDGGDL